MKCEVIRDLLPLYLDGCCSAESRELVEEHLSGCAECREILEHMERELDISLKEAEENLAEREAVKTGRKALKKEVKRDYRRKVTVADIILNAVLLCIFLYAAILAPLGQTVMLAGICAFFIVGEVGFLRADAEKESYILWQSLTVLSLSIKVIMLIWAVIVSGVLIGYGYWR